jgi:MbtH protein
MEKEEDQRLYEVVQNAEEQYSIWPADLPKPSGWVYAGRKGIKSECLDFIRQVWRDMRPLSVRSRDLT